jgi:predicted dehydrogenase
MTKKLKVGVIGIGGIAGTHIPGWQKSEDAEIVAFCDIVPEVLNRVSDKHCIDVRYENALDLIANPEIDVVDICTPNAFHAPYAIAALNAGKHVLCEKPLAPTPDEVLEMIAARDKSGKLLMTAQHFRFGNSAQALKAELSSGTLGDIYHARSWMLRRAAVPVRPGFIYKKNSGGGPCIDIGVHILDLTLWMMGHPKPVSVTGVTQDKLVHQAGAFTQWGRTAIPSDIDVEEFAAAFVRFDNGATLILEVSWALHHNVPGGGAEDMQMWLYGTEGGAHWPKNELLASNKSSMQFLNTQLQLAPNNAEAHAQECIAFAEAIVNGEPSPVPPEESLPVARILDGLYRSAATGKEILLP